MSDRLRWRYKNKIEWYESWVFSVKMLKKNRNLGVETDTERRVMAQKTPAVELFASHPTVWIHRVNNIDKPSLKFKLCGFKIFTYSYGCVQTPDSCTESTFQSSSSLLICWAVIWRALSCSCSDGILTSQDRKQRSWMRGCHCELSQLMSFKLLWLAHGCLWYDKSKNGKR